MHQAASVEDVQLRVTRDYGIDFNPVQGVQTAPGGRRTRNHTDPEIAKLLAALDGESEAGFHLMAHWFVLILLTAQRPGEVMAMQWAELDLEAGWWNVRTSTNGDPIHAALSVVTVSLLRALRAWAEREHARIERNCAARRGPRALSPFGFPARDIAVNRDERPMGSEQCPPTTRVRERMHVHDWNPHDLRRTGATVMARLGVPRFIIERVLNHRDSSVGGIYDRYSYTTERNDAVTKLGSHVESLATTNRLLPARLRAVEVA